MSFRSEESRSLSGRFAVIFGVFLAVALIFPVDANVRVGERSLVSVVHADDDEDEDEDEEEDEDEDEDEEEDEDDDKKKETVEVTRYEVRQVVRTVVVLAPEYETDTDGDLLVDGIDPDPKVHQREYFTDTDGDGIPNVFDRHHGEDDFAYYDGEEDADSDGLLDSYERLAER